MYKTISCLFFISICLPPLNSVLAANPGPNNTGIVNAVTVDLYKLKDAIDRKHPTAFQGYMQGIEREYATIYQQFAGKADHSHPVFSGLKNRINVLYVRNEGAYQSGSSQVSTTQENNSQISQHSTDQITAKTTDKPVGSQEGQEIVVPDYHYSEVYDGITGNILHCYKSNKETIIKSGVDKLSYASGTDILVAFKDNDQKETIQSIELQLSIVRAQLFSATKGSQVLTMPPKELIMLKPMFPITVILKGSEELIGLIQQTYNRKKSLEQALATLDSSFFPAIMNIEHYELIRYFQSKTIQ